MINFNEKIQELKELRKRYELGGGPDAIEVEHAKGKLTARERIEHLVDTGSFRELNLWAQPIRTGFDIDKREAPGDAVVAGFAKVGGRPVCVYAHDFTVLGGSQATVQRWRTCRTVDTAVKLGIPYIGIIDSGGVRIQDAFGINTLTGLIRDANVWSSPSIASGIVPSISVILGASYAGTAYSPFLADVVFMVNRPYCYMSLASPELLKSVTFKDVTKEEIGSPKLHAEVTGSCDYLGETEEEVLQKARELLNFLPSNCWEKPHFMETGDDPSRIDKSLLDVVPMDSKKPYDMHEVIGRLVDNGSFFELKREYAKNIIIGFARLGGHSVGIVANNPLILDGAIDLRAAEKEARFIRYSNAFNVPLIFLVDTPGFVADLNQEHEGLARHAAMAAYAMCEATVPKFTVYLRRCWNNGHLAMGHQSMGVDVVLAWPTAQVEIVDFKEAAGTVFHEPIEEVDRTTLQEFEKRYFDSPRHPGALLIIDDIIDPAETRLNLVYYLEITTDKKEIGPQKKHGNMPL